MRKLTALKNRLQAARARTDTRAWVMKRRERTRHLIELGGLVVKAGLDDITGDDRTTLYGAFLTLAMALRAPDGPATLELWRRRGRRAFEEEEAANSLVKDDSGNDISTAHARRKWRGAR